MRARADAILVGRGTAQADDPALTVRSARGPSPRRVLLDSDLSLPATARLFARDRTPPPLVYHAPGVHPDRRAALSHAGAECVQVPRMGAGVALEAVLRDLGRRDVMRLMVEAGPTLAGALLEARAVDHVVVFVAPMVIGDAEAVPLARGRQVDRLRDAIRLGDVKIRKYGDDVCLEGRPKPPGQD